MYTEKQVLVKNIYKWAKNRLTKTSLTKKSVHGVKTHWISGKEKVSGAAVIRNGDTNSVLGLVTIDFLEKGSTVKRAPFCQPFYKYPFIYWKTLIYLFNFIWIHLGVSITINLFISSIQVFWITANDKKRIMSRLLFTSSLSVVIPELWKINLYLDVWKLNFLVYLPTGGLFMGFIWNFCLFSLLIKRLSKYSRQLRNALYTSYFRASQVM